MNEISPAAIDELAASVLPATPRLLGAVPPRPAAELGRLGRPAEVSAMAAAAARDLGEMVSPSRRRGLQPAPQQSDGPPVLSALDSLDVRLAERLLGALELTVGTLVIPAPAALGGRVSRASGVGSFVSLDSRDDSETRRAAMLLERLRPGTAALVESVTRKLIAHESIAPLLTLTTDSAADEASIAAAHGAAYLAVAVAAAFAALEAVDAPVFAGGPSAVVGFGLGAAVVLLREAAMPAGYTEAVLAHVRAHFLLPRRTSEWVPVAAGRGFAITEDAWPDAPDFSGNGLVAVTPDGPAIRTGLAAGAVNVSLEVRKDPPEQVATEVWDEVVEVSWTAARGLASVIGSGDEGPAARLRAHLPPWPGDYRLRVHAGGRDGDHMTEHYHLIVWQPPAAPEIVHKATDQLGHRLRGEPECRAEVIN